MAEWSVLLPEYHPGFIDWATFQANQARIDTTFIRNLIKQEAP
jgi:hypothetical protein